MIGQRGRCRSGKIRYRNELDAKIDLANITASPDKREKKPRRAYRCNMCSGYHLTSQK